MTSNGVTVCGSKFPPSVSIANINKKECPKPSKDCEIPTQTALVISKVLLPQSNIMTAFVHSHNLIFSDVSPGLLTHRNHNVTKFTTNKITPAAEVLVVVVVLVVVLILVVVIGVIVV
jgi:hypothetical protein